MYVNALIRPLNVTISTSKIPPQPFKNKQNRTVFGFCLIKKYFKVVLFESRHQSFNLQYVRLQIKINKSTCCAVCAFTN